MKVRQVMVAALHFPFNEPIGHFLRGCDFTKTNAMIVSYGPQSPGVNLKRLRYAGTVIGLLFSK